MKRVKVKPGFVNPAFYYRDEGADRWLALPGKDDPKCACKHPTSDWLCTLAPGHAGEHLTIGDWRRIYARWGDVNAPATDDTSALVKALKLVHFLMTGLGVAPKRRRAR